MLACLQLLINCKFFLWNKKTGKSEDSLNIEKWFLCWVVKKGIQPWLMLLSCQIVDSCTKGSRACTGVAGLILGPRQSICRRQPIDPCLSLTSLFLSLSPLLPSLPLSLSKKLSINNNKKIIVDYIIHFFKKSFIRNIAGGICEKLEMWRQGEHNSGRNDASTCCKLSFFPLKYDFLLSLLFFLRVSAD